MCVESRINVPEVSERAHEQASTGEHDYGKRNLSNDQGTAEAEMAARDFGRVGTGGAFFQRRSHIDATAAKRRRNSEKNSREQGNA